MKCRQCGAELDEGALFCRTCGAAVSPEPEPEPILFEPEPEPERSEPVAASAGRCRVCGAELDEGALFCRTCGAAASPEPEPAEESVPEPAAASVPEPAAEHSSEHAEHAPKKHAVHRKRFRLPKLNRRLLAAIGVAVVLLAVLVTVIVCAVSCGGKDGFQTPDELKDAVIAALEKGDGDRLQALAKTSEPILGQHPEEFGEGKTPNAVMQNYYRTMAKSLKTRLDEQYGKGFRLELPAETTLLTGADTYETNRALGVDAPQYAVIGGTLFVEGNSVGTISMTAAEIDGEWKLLVVYIY